jgi:competence protein ComEC
VTASVLHPPRLALGGVADDDAVVILTTMPAGRVLFMSDNGEPTERALLRMGGDLHADILVKGQNHFSPSGTEQFLDAVQPRLIISTARSFPSYERISEDWVGRLRERGIKLFRQDETGAVELRFWNRGWEAKAYATGEIFRSVSR